MSKSVKLLLIESVDSLGIVGDVVNVRTGYARNFLLPRNLATKPDENLIKSLASKRAEAEKQLAQQRQHREETIGKLQGLELSATRSCNDQGILYGAITQQEICKLLAEKGYQVKAREIRINETIKRVGSYDVHVKLDSDLDAIVKVKVDADRELEPHRKEEERKGDSKKDAEAATEEGKSDAKSGQKPGEKGDKPERRERKDRDDRPKRGDRLAQALAMANSEENKKTGWAAAKASQSNARAASETKSESKPAAGAEGKGDAKAEAKAEAKTEAKAGKPEKAEKKSKKKE